MTNHSNQKNHKNHSSDNHTNQKNQKNHSSDNFDFLLLNPTISSKKTIDNIMEQNPTMTNTKKEILAAYNELLKKKEAESSRHPKEEKAEKQKEETVKVARSLSAEGIVKGLADMKLNISVSIDKIEDSLLHEFQKLEKLQEAISYESAYLEELYGIKANADSLAVLLTANKEKKQAFETEMEQRKTIFEEIMREKKQEWDKEQKEREQKWKEEDNDRKRAISREEEEFKYAKNLSRKKEEDEYQAKKAAQEKELADQKQSVEKALEEREKGIATKEQELETLRSQVANFPATLEKEIAAARMQSEEQLTTRYQFEKDLFTKEMEGENKLLQQAITSLQAKIKEQDSLIASLNEKASTAGAQVQTIALKALDSASSLRYSPVNSGEKREDKESGK
ncbi:hypothetical protein BH20BAC1_BH20BAC1_03430 [soil metagenome]